jgi:hypothetical protein
MAFALLDSINKLNSEDEKNGDKGSGCKLLAYSVQQWFALIDEINQGLRR